MPPGKLHIHTHTHTHTHTHAHAHRAAERHPRLPATGARRMRGDTHAGHDALAQRARVWRIDGVDVLHAVAAFEMNDLNFEWGGPGVWMGALMVWTYCTQWRLSK